MLSTRPKSYVPVDWGVKAKQSVLGKPELLNVEFCNVTDHSVLFILSEETFSLETKYFLLGGISVTVGVVAGLVGGKAKSGVSKIYTKIQKQVNLPEQRFHVMPGGGIRVKIRWGGGLMVSLQSRSGTVLGVLSTIRTNKLKTAIGQSILWINTTTKYPRLSLVMTGRKKDLP